MHRRLYGGTSGSPIIQTGTRFVVGSINSINENGRKCSMNNSREVNEAGELMARKSTGFGQQASNIYLCLTHNFKIDLKKSGCELFSK